MTAPPPGRPWWKRKRWWAAGALWLMLPAAYLASRGAMYYAFGRGWLSRDAARWAEHEFYYNVVDRALARRDLDGLQDRWIDFCDECFYAGNRRAASD